MTHSITFTGGGTAGHVTPNIALIEIFLNKGYTLHYIGSKQGVEHTLIHPLGIPFHPIRSGKLRRYWSIKNILDPFNVGIGILQSLLRLYQCKPNVVFSKGGFVAFPVVFSAWLLRIPVIIHESDLTPGLANRLSIPFAKQVIHGFKMGTPIRHHLFQGNKQRGLEMCQFNTQKLCLLIIGGSLGSVYINKIIRATLDKLLPTFQIIHICGRNNIDSTLINIPGYRQFDYVNAELPDLFAAADIVISRAGANTLFELLALKKPHLLIPLSRKASRGDQIQNAAYFEKQGTSIVLLEENLNPESLCHAIQTVQTRMHALQQHMTAVNMSSATEKIAQLIQSYL